MVERKMGESPNDLVIITGMSGAGRTEAMHAFEDLGYFCIDNLPASLLGQLLVVTADAGSGLSRKLAVVCDARNKDYFADLDDELDTLKSKGIPFRIVFLDADDDKLVARYKASRRRHPLCDEGMTIAQGITAERALLYQLRVMAQDVVNTTDMLPMQLRAKIRELFGEGDEREGLAVTVYSFGFKHGAALDADIVIDVRFLPNPFYIPDLRNLTGLDSKVADYVLGNEETHKFLDAWENLLNCVMPGYVAEGKQQLAIGVGCTGGQHRSVVLANKTAELLAAQDYNVNVYHRDIALADTNKEVEK